MTNLDLFQSLSRFINIRYELGTNSVRFRYDFGTISVRLYELGTICHFSLLNFGVFLSICHFSLLFFIFFLYEGYIVLCLSHFFLDLP